MDLTFLGRGSAFNTTEGNNCAFFKQNGKMLLIDCGETTFSAIKQKNVLQDVEQVFVVITHTNSDHIGSLSSLALFCYFAKKTKINIVLSPFEKHNQLVLNLLYGMGANSEWINTVSVEQMLSHFDSIQNLTFLPTPHVEEFDSYGLEFKTDKGIVYYSADTSTDKYVKQYIALPTLHKMYVDTSKSDYEGNVHLSTAKLTNAVEPSLRHKVWCMHIDNIDNIPTLKQLGFNVVEVL
jgi:mRNA degradation ribonuclease J1/J2